MLNGDVGRFREWCVKSVCRNCAVEGDEARAIGARHEFNGEGWAGVVAEEDGDFAPGMRAVADYPAGKIAHREFRFCRRAGRVEGAAREAPGWGPV